MAGGPIRKCLEVVDLIGETRPYDLILIEAETHVPPILKGFVDCTEDGIHDKKKRG